MSAKEKDKTVEGSLAYELSHLKLKYEDPYLKLLDRHDNELTRTIIIPGNHEHDYTEEITKEATCTKDGIKTYTCGCGDSYSENIPAIGSHNFVDGVCTVCGELRYEFAPADAINNWDYSLDDANKLVTLNGYTGSETDVIVYENYVINGETYKAKFKDDASSMFEYKKSIKSIKFSPNFDTSNVTSMRDIFCDCFNITSIDLSYFNSSNVTNMDGMFKRCKLLTTLDLSNFDTSSVTSMREMFLACSSLTSLNLDNFNTSNVTDMYDMFYYCRSLTSLDLSSFDTSNVKSMDSMFSECNSLIFLDLNGFDTSNVEIMRYMFSNMSSLTSLDIGNFNTSKVTWIDYMFFGCTSLTSLDLSNFDTSKVSEMRYVFEDCTNLKTIYVSRDKWVTSQADTTNMFLNCGTSEVTYK